MKKYTHPIAPILAVTMGLALTTSTALSVTATAGPAEPQRCPGGIAIVLGANQSDFADICKGVEAAIEFFAKYRVIATEPVFIEVTPSIPIEAGPTAAGCYIEQKRKIYILPYNSFLKNKTWFNVKIDRVTYQALATHEAAHAIAACSFAIPNPTIQAKEYLAYTAMLTGMPPKARDKAIAATHIVGFESIDRFTPVLYMFDPMRFGAEAYRHFTRVEDKAFLIESILGGKELLD
jgi:hypothetical protein